MSRTVLVTGAAGGSGRAIAVGLAERGHDVAINGPFGITVNAVCPGIIVTDMARANLGDQASIDRWTGVTQLKRLGEPEDVVGSMAFSAGPDSANITGQSLNVDGGIIFS